MNVLKTGRCFLLALCGAFLLAGSAAAQSQPGADKLKPKKKAKATTTSLIAAFGSAAANEPYGPMIVVPKEWRRCKAASDCAVVYSGCGTANVTINKDFRKAARADWKRLCKAAKREPMGLLTSAPEMTCEKSRCGSRMRYRGLGDLRGGLAGGRSNKSKDSSRLSAATLRFSHVATKGGLHKEVVRRVLRGRRKQLLYCYQTSQVDGPYGPVKMKLKAELTARGRVTRVSASAGPKGLRPCVTRIVRRFRFAAPKGGAAEFEVTAHFRAPAPAPAPAPAVPNVPVPADQK